MRKEFEEQQRKSVLNSAAAGGGNPLGNIDVAGWAARQTHTQQPSGHERVVGQTQKRQSSERDRKAREKLLKGS